MAIMRIAFAAATLLYIAPQLGADILRTARPFLPGSSSEPHTATIVAETAVAYCRSNPEACLKIAHAALRTDPSEPSSEPAPSSLAHASLRPALQEPVPLPPSRPPALRPAIK